MRLRHCSAGNKRRGNAPSGGSRTPGKRCSGSKGNLRPKPGCASLIGINRHGWPHVVAPASSIRTNAILSTVNFMALPTLRLTVNVVNPRKIPACVNAQDPFSLSWLNWMGTVSVDATGRNQRLTQLARPRLWPPPVLSALLRCAHGRTSPGVPH